MILLSASPLSPLLGPRVVERLHDPRRHVADERRRLGDDLVPAALVPHVLPRLAPVVQAVVAPDVLHVVELSHLNFDIIWFSTAELKQGLEVTLLFFSPARRFP